MPKRVIEIPDELNELGDVFEAVLANVRRTVAPTGGGKAVDYAQVEAAVSDDGARVERATHRAILQSLDVDVPAIIIGGCATTGSADARRRTTHGRARCRSSDRCTGDPGRVAARPRGRWWTR